jgi:hypothetical protein
LSVKIISSYTTCLQTYIIYLSFARRNGAPIEGSQNGRVTAQFGLARIAQTGIRTVHLVFVLYTMTNSLKISYKSTGIDQFIAFFRKFYTHFV